MWVLALLACGQEPEAEPAGPALEGRVTWEPARAAARVPFATLPAEVVSSAGGRMELGPGVPGRIVAWEVRPGDHVRAGDPLARLVSPELGDLGTQVAEASTRVVERARIVDDRRRAEARGVVSRSAVTEAEADLAEARAALDALRARLELHGDTVQRDGDGLVWRAPADARVAELSCPIGSLGADQACVALVQDGGGLLEVRVPERHLGALTGPVSATFTAADGRESSFSEISRAPEVDPRSRSLRLLLAPEGGEGPLVGVSGRARLEVAAGDGLAEVPASALARDGTDTLVLVRDGDGHRPAPVRVLGRRGEEVVVAGITAGDEVAVRGVFLLRSLAALEEAP